MEGLGSNLCNHIVKEVIKHSENRLRLWHVSVPGGMDLGYDSYDSFVVACYTEDEARNTSPGGIDMSNKDKTHSCWWGWINRDDISQLIVTEIGYAKEGISFRSVIIASFNAG